MSKSDYLRRMGSSSLRSGASISPLHVITTRKENKGRRIYQLQTKLVLQLSLNGAGQIYIEVPEGYETDFSSVPRWFWWLFPHDEVAEAAVIHDYLYEKTNVDRFIADAIFRIVIKLLNKPYWKRILYYWAVRSGGGIARSL